MRCWHGYISGARCKWFAYDPADATATHHLLLHKNPEWLTFLVPAYTGYPGKQAVKWVSVRRLVLASESRHKRAKSLLSRVTLSMKKQCPADISSHTKILHTPSLGSTHTISYIRKIAPKPAFELPFCVKSVVVISHYNAVMGSNWVDVTFNEHICTFLKNKKRYHLY